MIPELLEELKQITELEEKILNSPQPVMSHFVDAKNPDMIARDKVIGTDKLIAPLMQPRFVEFPMHGHEYMDMIYMYDGKTMHVMEDGTNIHLEKDDLLLLSPKARHACSSTGYDDIALHFLILPEFLQGPLEMLKTETVLRRFLINAANASDTSEAYLHYHLQDIPEAKNLLENMILTLRHNLPNHQDILQYTAGLLFLVLLERTDKIILGTPTSYEYEIVANALSYITENYATASLESFASLINEPPYYVSRLIRKYSPYTFTEHLQKKRLLRAAFLLTNSSQSVEEIIAEVGYDNSSYFHRLFKEMYGTTPKKYRTRHSNP